MKKVTKRGDIVYHRRIYSLFYKKILKIQQGIYPVWALYLQGYSLITTVWSPPENNKQYMLDQQLVALCYTENNKKYLLDQQLVAFCST